MVNERPGSASGSTPRRAGLAVRLAAGGAALLPVASCTGPVPRPAGPPPRAALVLDAAAPFVEARLAGVPVRLRVTLAAQGPIDLAPAVAARLPVRWRAAEPIDVGRVRLPGRAALTELVVAGVAVPVEVADHGRPATAGDDGEVAPSVLPFATVAWRRPAAPPPATDRLLPLAWDGAFGYAAAAEVPGLALRFDPAQPVSSATAAAGARLARAWGGRLAGSPYPLAAPFGVARVVQRLAFARPGLLAGFPVAELPVRLADFAGHEALPVDPPLPGELVVSRRVVPQRGWPAVTLGADRLARCRELLFTAAPLALTLRCAP